MHSWSRCTARPHRLLRTPDSSTAIAVAVQGDSVGTLYATAGLQLTYQDGDVTKHAFAWGGDVTCVVADWKHHAWCDKASPLVSDVVANYIHQQ